MNLPRKRTIIAWHRWMGLLSALFLVVLSITGLALNHTERLGLDQIQVTNSFILECYGMADDSEISAYCIHESNTLAHLDGQLFYNGQPLFKAEEPIGIVEGDLMSVVATPTQLIYLNKEGEIIETVHNRQLPYSQLIAVGEGVDKQPILVTEDGLWIPDQDWIHFKTYQASYNVDPITQVDLSESETTSILDAFQGGGVSLYRVMLDLHAGRLFGWGGRTLMDLTAVAIILLVASGIGGWLRKSRQIAKPREA